MTQACSGGAGDACFELGSMYESAEGVPRDIQPLGGLLQAGLHGGQQQSCVKVSTADRARPTAQQVPWITLPMTARRWAR